MFEGNIIAKLTDYHCLMFHISIYNFKHRRSDLASDSTFIDRFHQMGLRNHKTERNQNSTIGHPDKPESRTCEWDKSSDHSKSLGDSIFCECLCFWDIGCVLGCHLLCDNQSPRITTGQ